MRKWLIIFCLILLLTGCSKDEKVVKNPKNKKEETKEVVQKEAENDNLFTDSSVAGGEEELVTYIEQVDKEVEQLTNYEDVSISAKQKLKNTFITLTDFVFYGGTIKGKTFKDLSLSAQEKVLNLLTSIDQKIASIDPDYKESIKDVGSKTYKNVKGKIQGAKESVQEKYRNYVGESAYNDLQEIYQSDKERFIDAYNPYVEKGKEVANSAKEKAIKTKDKIKDWYHGYKTGE